MEIEETQNNQSNLDKEESWGTVLPELQITLIRILCYCHKDGHIDQCNRIHNPDMNPFISGQFNKEISIIQWGKEQHFQQILMRQLDIHRQKNEGELFPYTLDKN